MRKKVQNQLTSIIFFALSAIAILANGQNGSYTLGNNIISNPGFEAPSIPPNEYFISVSSGMDSWICTNICQIVSLPYTCSNVDSRYCPMISNSQVLDTQSLDLQNISQIITLVANASYSFGFKWLPPQTNTLSSKQMNVWMNGTIVSTISINNTNSNVSDWNQEAMILQMAEGNLTLMFQTKGISDGYGIYVDDVFLRELIPDNTTNSSVSSNTTSNSINNTDVTFNETLANQTVDVRSFHGYLKVMMDYSFNGEFMQILNQYPGSRVFFMFLMNFNINLDRLQFYYFHHQNFTEYSLILIENTYFFLQEKGCFFEILTLEQCNGSTVFKNIYSLGQMIQSTLMFKDKYQNAYINRRVQNGGGFIQNQFGFFYYQIPFSILTVITCFLLFKLLCRYRLSLPFRKYCFLGIIMLVFFEGNVEEFTFYVLLQLKMFFSATALHKLVNVLLIIFWFAAVFFGFAVLPFCFFWYRKRAKYLMEQCKPVLLSVVAASIDSGVIPLISGFIHALYLQQLLPTTLFLVFMEATWSVVRVAFLRKKLYLHNTRISIQITAGVLRIVLLLSLYQYQCSGDGLINNLHLAAVICYISLWFLQLLFSLFLFLKAALVIFKSYFTKKNRISDDQLPNRIRIIKAQNQLLGIQSILSYQFNTQNLNKKRKRYRIVKVYK